MGYKSSLYDEKINISKLYVIGINRNYDKVEFSMYMSEIK